MELVVEAQAVPLEMVQGVMRVSGTRITLNTLVGAFQDGATAEEIAQQYPTVPLDDVYAAITYYLRNRAAVDAYLTAPLGCGAAG